MHKLSGANKRFGRCPIHGQGCEVAHEMRVPLPRKTELDRHIQEELEFLHQLNTWEELWELIEKR